jgi:FecR protein
VSEDPKIDLEAWEPQLPPSDFAERVLGRVRAESETKQPASRVVAKGRRWGVAAGVTGVLALAAALAVRITNMPPSHGEAIAKDRLEVSIGSRARAVLEPGAEVKWDGDDVVQAHGDVFYRVEPGARFRVHTPAGDVEVKGTCFAVKIRNEATASKVEGVAMDKRDVKSGVIGAALTGLAFVAVYEGKVAVSHAGERLDLGAGETAQVGSDGVHRSGKLGDGEKAFDAKAASASSSESMAQANDNLVSQVSEYRARLEAIAAQKIELEQKLKKSEEKLASVDGGTGRTRPEYDLSQDDWAELAKKGEVKFRRPCFREEGWTFNAEKLQKLGLAPQDAAPLHDAYAASYKRLWTQIRPMCATALGSSMETVDKIGADLCTHLIYELYQKEDKENTAEAHTQVAEMRAGLRPEPAAGEKQHPVMKLFLMLTSANKAFENDLAKSLGPEEAYRLSMSDDMCTSNSRWGGGKKREETKK